MRHGNAWGNDLIVVIGSLNESNLPLCGLLLIVGSEQIKKNSRVPGERVVCQTLLWQHHDADFDEDC